MLLAWKIEEGATSQGEQSACANGKRRENGFSARAFRKEHSPADTLRFASDACRTLDLQDGKVIHSCCFEPLSLLW